ncbi:MAG TPA: ester cyclase [Dehalococcoidia bacterium]|jgi:steroid delta-isomerase-like uncharacterized protein
MISHQTMRHVLQEHVDAENAHNRERVLATYTPDSPVFEDVPSARRYVGADEIVGNYRHLWDGFPGLDRRIDRWTFGDDSCAIELTLSGVHDGPYRGIPPTGRRLELRIMAHFTFDDEGRITQETAYYDTLSFMRQLGLTESAR